MSILIIEDNPTNAMILKHLARKVADDDITVQADANDALALCHTTMFDMLIVDQILPGMTGLQFIKAIRQIHRYDDVPIIMVTADNDPALRKAAQQNGVTDFLTKPVEAMAFRQLIATHRGRSTIAD